MVHVRQTAIFVIIWSVLTSDVTFAAELDEEWNLFVKTYHKVYDNQLHEQQSRSVWEDNIDFIRTHNLQHDMGYKSFRVGVNEYADWSWVQFKKYMCGFKPHTISSPRPTFRVPNIRLDDNVDWRTKGYVTPVKNQGACGSCWAFSSTGSLEGQHFRRTGRLVSLSEQNLVDCTKYGNAGCNGGWMDHAFQYVIDNNGIDTESFYPYEGKDSTCRYNVSGRGAVATGFTDVTKGDEYALQTAVATVGPISIAIDASHRSFQLYKSGVYYEPECSNVTSDHAVLIVGYGDLDDEPYWLVKNSWTTSWGMDGYIMMHRGKNMCAVATYASFPTM